MYLYIDEVERVMSPAYVELLAQIRKYGLSLILINQFLKQLPAETISGIKGTVGTFVSFAQGSDDAKIIRLRHKLCTVARTIQTISGIFIPKILPVYEGR